MSDDLAHLSEHIKASQPDGDGPMAARVAEVLGPRMAAQKSPLAS